MRALALVCTLNASPAPASNQHLAEQVMDQAQDEGANSMSN